MAGNLWQIEKYSDRQCTCTTPKMIAKERKVFLEDALLWLGLEGVMCAGRELW
jgi:hypothetical protein